MKSGDYVVITTNRERRGVFAGTLVEHHDGHCTLNDAHQCIYWSEETKGVFGLAAIGPQSGSKIGPCIPQIQLDGVTSVALASEVARKQWELEPWS